MDFAIVIDNKTGVGAMTYEKATSIMNNIYLSLAVQRGAFFANPSFGSRLYELSREKNTEKTMRLAIDYCREALQWMIDCGKASAVNVWAARNKSQDLHRLNVLIEVTPANDGQPVAYSIFINVV